MPELSALESTAAFWDWVSYIGLLIAFLGAVSEFITSWTSWIKPPWKLKIEKTSALIVLVGSAAGLVASWKLSNINGQIIAILNRQVAAAQQEAGRAMTTAADAQTRLEEAKARTVKVEEAVANAHKAAKEAEAKARKFEAEIASSNARAEEAKRIAERERLERVKLAAQVAPRLLSVEQQNTIVSSLKRFRGRNVAVVSYSLDVEGGVLATQIISTLHEAGILVENQVAGLLVTGSFWTGVILSGPPAEQDFVKAITTSFANDGYLVARNNGTKPIVPVGISKLGENAVFILVGSKPPQTKLSK